MGKLWRTASLWLPPGRVVRARKARDMGGPVRGPVIIYDSCNSIQFPSVHADS